MPVANFLMSIVAALTAPFKRLRPVSKPNPNRHSYKLGFMADEIEALQSIFHRDDSQRPKKDK
jgi:hypothetical protein